MVKSASKKFLILFNTSWAIAGVLTALLLILRILLVFVSAFFRITNPTLPLASLVIAPMIAGMIYSEMFKTLIDKKLRINAILIFLAVQLLAGLLFFYNIKLLNEEFIFLTIFMIFGMAIYGLVIYWLMGVGSKITLKRFKKLKKHSKSKISIKHK